MMKFLKASIVIFSIFVFLYSICLSEEDINFPEVGFVRNDGANVRAGYNINFESLCRLEKGDPVKIVGSEYSWFKILLPNTAHLYIKKDYVDMTSEKGVGVVNASRVNLRAGPETKYSILGQVSSPLKLDVLAEVDGWYEITPPKGTAGWINFSQVRFTLKEMRIK